MFHKKRWLNEGELWKPRDVMLVKVSDVFFSKIWFPFLFVIPTASYMGLCERKHSIGCVLMNFSLLMAAYWGYM